MALFGFTNKDFDPHKLSSPQVFLLSMMIFLIIVAFVAAILYRQVAAAFSTNPGLNGLILGVLVVGIVLVFGQVLSLFKEVRWVNSFRTGDPGTKEPILLAPMKSLLSRNQVAALSTSSMRSILESIATRLDESRDTSRYLTGLLVFLGLLGTFWGLLQTIGSISQTINTLDPTSGNTSDVLDALKIGLQKPLEGMGTAFSSSLFGLSGSLVLGFLDLQAGRAQNRFYVELENWLSTVTDLGSDMIDKLEGGATEELKTLSDRLGELQAQGAPNEKTTSAMAELAQGISGLVKNMRAEQQMVRDWAESQAEETRETRRTMERVADLLEERMAVPTSKNTPSKEGEDS